MKRDCAAGAGPRESDARLNGDPGAARPCRSTHDHARLRAGCRGHIVSRIRLETVARIDSERVHLINAVR